MHTSSIRRRFCSLGAALLLALGTSGCGDDAATAIDAPEEPDAGGPSWTGGGDILTLPDTNGSVGGAGAETDGASTDPTGDAGGAARVADAADATSTGEDTGAPGEDATPGDGEETDGDERADGASAPGDPGPQPLALEALGEHTDGPFARTWRVRIGSMEPVEEVHNAATPHVDARVVAHFGDDDTPPADEVLVHAWPGYEDAEGAVLLVHGAGGWAELNFADPALGVSGLASALSQRGWAVYALTFPHVSGEVTNQAAQLAGALQWVRAQAKVPKAHVVAHSKGGLAAVSYTAGLAAARGADYVDDIDGLVLLGVPLGGMDYTFRHPSVGASASVWGFPVPSPWEATLGVGGFVLLDTYEASIYHPAYRGMQQLLWPWIDTYPLSMLQQDWYTTYYGGDGFVSRSRGIDEAISLGGDYMEALWARSVPASIRAALVAGGNPFINGVMTETDGASDGLVFISSATDTRLFADPDAVEVKTFALVNHPGLVLDPVTQAWVSDYLTGP